MGRTLTQEARIDKRISAVNRKKNLTLTGKALLTCTAFASVSTHVHGADDDIYNIHLHGKNIYMTTDDDGCVSVNGMCINPKKDQEQDVRINQNEAYASASMEKNLKTTEAMHNYADNAGRSAVAAANFYTDSKFRIFDNLADDIGKQARNAAAIGLAASSLRFDNNPGKWSVATGYGNWSGSNAFAVGTGYTSRSGRIRANITSVRSDNKWGISGGASFTLN